MRHYVSNEGIEKAIANAAHEERYQAAYDLAIRLGKRIQQTTPFILHRITRGADVSRMLRNVKRKIW